MTSALVHSADNCRYVVWIESSKIDRKYRHVNIGEDVCAFLAIHRLFQKPDDEKTLRVPRSDTA